MKTILSTITNFIKAVGEKNISVYAAGIAFFWMLSAVPIIVIVSSVFPYVGLSEEIITEILTRILPETTKQYLDALVSHVYSQRIGMLPLAFLIAIWSAGRGMLSLIRGLNGIHGIVEKRGYFKLRIIASFYTIVLVAGLVSSLIVLVFGESIFRIFLADIPVLRELVHLIFGARYPVVVLVLSIIFTLLYTYVPDVHTSVRKQFFGGFLAAVSCAVFSYCFSVYVDNFNDFSSYGSINIVIIIMLWLYFTMYILLYGAYIGSYFAKEAPK